MSDTRPATSSAHTRRIAGLGLLVVGLIAVVIGLGVALNTHTNDFACNPYVQSCPTASPAEQAASKRMLFYTIAGLGGMAALGGMVVTTATRK